MQSVEDIANEIVAREGGYVDDPADPGGPTNRGVTLATLRCLGRDVDGNGTIDADDLRGLSAAEASQIFVKSYYEAPNIAALPEALRPQVFDMYVNSGANAVRILQRLLIQMGFPCAVDGAIGPQTAKAAAAAAQAAPGFITDAYAIARRNWYYGVADARPASRKFARTRTGGKGGWITRTESFMSPRYRLTDAQHRERTATWA